MNRLNDGGVWSAFIPGLDEGTLYKYAIKSSVNKKIKEKIDPYAFYAEVRPKTASIVKNLDNYVWNDNEWTSHRNDTGYWKKPISVYEVHLG